MTTNAKGFTLIELLIVVGIIGILAAAIIVAITPGERLQEAREATMRAHQQTIGTAVHVTMIDNEYADMTAFFGGTNCVNNIATAMSEACATDIGLPRLPSPPTGSGYTMAASGTSRVTIDCGNCTAITY